MRRPQIKKYYKTDPPKSGNSDSKYNLKFSKNKIKLKKGPLKFQKIINIYEEASNQKVKKQTPTKKGSLIQNTILL